MTTTASASSPTRICRWPYAVAPSPGPVTTISIGSAIWVSRADGDDRRVVERRERLRGNAVGGHTALTEPLVAAAHRFHGDAGLLRDG